MPKNKKNKNNTTAKIIGIILLVLLAFAGGFFIAQRFTGGNNNGGEPENNQAKTDKPTVIENNDNPQIDKPEEVDEKDKTPAKYDGEDPNDLDTLTGTVTYSGMAGDKLIIRVSIDQYLGSGTCLLTLGGYGAVANISASASTSTCEGFDIPLSSISDLSGNTQFTINLSSGDRTGVISGEVGL